MVSDIGDRTDNQPELGPAFVASLDFELHWGIRDTTPIEGRYRQQLLGARRAVPELLATFREFEIAATWATVGFLFASTRAEVERYAPARRPGYVRPRLSPYQEAIGDTEAEDPFHLARSLVQLIAASPGQEVASHTFSHYYCLEPGQGEAEFRADLESAVAAAEDCGLRLRTLVFPRNQGNPDYLQVLRELGFSAYRGNQRGTAYEADPEVDTSAWRRLRRLADAYVDLDGPSLVGWAELRDQDGLYNVRASRFLRPYTPALGGLEPLRLRRITRSLDEAARTGQIFHLWWHPDNFGAHLEENLAFLRKLLNHFSKLRDNDGMRSLSVGGVAERAAAWSP